MDEIINDPEAIKAIMEEIHRNKVESAERWKEMQIQLANDIVESQKEILENEKQSIIDEYYEGKMIDILSQFEGLQNSNSKDLNAYITANPGRREIFEKMMEDAKKYHGKSKRPQQKVKLPPITFEDQVPELMEKLNETIDMSNLIIFADRAFLYMGEIYTHQTKILFKTRAGPGNEMPATIYNITEFELTVYFEDKGFLTIKAQDVIDRKVEILPMPPQQ